MATSADMIEIDGAQGEGGGQILRSSLALSAITGRPVRIHNIRARRKRAGLMRQHLTAVQAISELCSARVTGADIGSSCITFEPGVIRAGEYDFQVGTAGSATLIAQTVLPALMIADQPSMLSFGGGTHNPWAPPYDFLHRAFLPQIAKMGPEITAELDSHGFYPAGGGRFRLQVSPSAKLTGLELLVRAGAMVPRVEAIVSEISASIGQRECDTIRRKSGWSSDVFSVRTVEQPKGPGNVVVVDLAYDNVTEVVTAFGEKGVKAESVARAAYRAVQTYLDHDAPVGEFLADQLMIPLAIAAAQGQVSQFRTATLSRHSQTQLNVIPHFLDVSTHAQTEEAGTVRVCVGPMR